MSWLALPKKAYNALCNGEAWEAVKSSTIKIMTNLYYVMYGIDYRRSGYDEVRKLQILLYDSSVGISECGQYDNMTEEETDKYYVEGSKLSLLEGR